MMRILRIVQGQTIRNIGMMFLAQSSARVLSAIALVIVLRSMSQDQYGLVAFVQSLIITASGAFLQGLNWSVVRFLSVNRNNGVFSAKYLRASFLLTLMVSSGVGLGAAILADKLLELFVGISTDDFIAGYVFLGVIAFSLFNFVTAVLQSNESFRRVALLQLSQGAFLLALYAAFALLQSLSVKIVLLGMTIIPLLVLPIGIRKTFAGDLIGEYSVREATSVAKGSGWFILYSLMLVIVGQLDVIMMAAYFTLVDVAIYSVAAKLFGMFVLGLGAIHSVLLPKLSARPESNDLRMFLRRSARFAAPIAIGIVATASILGEEIVWVVAGDGYSEAVAPLQILALCAAVSLVFSPSVNVLMALNRKRIIFFGGVLCFITGSLGHLFLTRRFGAVGAALTTMLAYSTINLFMFVFALRETATGPIAHVGPSKQEHIMPLWMEFFYRLLADAIALYVTLSPIQKGKRRLAVMGGNVLNRIQAICGVRLNSSSTKNTARMILMFPEDIAYVDLYFRGTYEVATSAFLQEFLRDDDVVFDIGANIGYITLLSALRACQGEVHSFEPVRHSYHRLLHNLSLNRAMTNIYPNQQAVAQRTGRVTVNVFNELQHGYSSMFTLGRTDYVSLRVSAITVDTYVRRKRISKIDFMKVDVEGAEMFVLQGAAKSITAFSPSVMVEMNIETSRLQGFNPTDLLAYLRSKHDYDFYRFPQAYGGMIRMKSLNDFQNGDNVAGISPRHKERLKQLSFANSKILALI